MMNWYIGQEVVCIKTHSQGIVKEGEVYIIKSLELSPCKCKDISIDVGKHQIASAQSCPACGSIWDKLDSRVWLAETRFAPLSDISELESILNEEKVKA